jgi:hypothetical protein
MTVPALFVAAMFAIGTTVAVKRRRFSGRHFLDAPVYVGKLSYRGQAR